MESVKKTINALLLTFKQKTMKKIYSILTLIFMCSFAFAQTYNITLQVNMKGQAISANGVHAAGNFQAAAGFAGDWDPSTTALTDSDGDSTYSITVQLPAGTYEYKFVNGNAWGSDEAVPGIVQLNGNRFFNVAKDDTLGAVMYGGTAPMGMSFVRLQADMREQMKLGTPVDTVDGVLAIDAVGSFTAINWDQTKAAELMDADGDSIFDGYTYSMTGGFEMKFRHGRDWSMSETVVSGLPCENNTNRVVNVPGDTVVGPICYNKCQACVATVLDTFNVTFRVDMRNKFILDGPGSMVSIAGNFQSEAGGNDWSPGEITLTDADGDSVYEASVTLVTPDAVNGVFTFSYKYLNGGAWGSEEPVPPACNVGGNREVAVSGDTTLPAFCFGTCVEGCPPILDPINITFRVDMTQEVPSGKGIHLTGNFMQAAGLPNNWQKDTLEMLDANGIGVYEVTVTMRPSDYEYKFVNGDSDPEEENGDFLAGGCGVSNGIGGFNRLLAIDGLQNDTVLPVYIYNTCNISTIGIGEIADKNVGFSVYPNPMKNNATIWFANNEQNLRVQLFDIAGKAVIDQSNISNNFYVIQKNNLKSGIYILKVSNQSGFSSVEKLVVE